MQYDPKTIQPFRDELTRIGFRELKSGVDVDTMIKGHKGTTLVVINSVCGCAAGKARPGLAMALQQSPVKPDDLTTVFAGGDIEATARLREHLGDIPPSSPSMALFKDGEIAHFIPRYQIENKDASSICQHLLEVFGKYCGSVQSKEAASG